MRYTLDEAKRLKKPMVYGLQGADEVIFYVGATRDPYSRFHRYAQRTTNLHLLRRLKAAGMELRVVVLVEDPDDLLATEHAKIVELSSQLTNQTLNPFRLNQRVKPGSHETLGICPQCDAMRFKINSDYCGDCLSLLLGPTAMPACI